MAAVDRLIDLVADLATLDTPDDAAHRLPDLLGRLAGEVGADACQVDAATTASRGAATAHWQTVASVGYSRPVSHHLGGEFLSSAHGRLVLDSVQPLRIETDAHGFRGSTHFHDVLHPAGYDDGVSLALRAPDGVVIGIVHLSAGSADDLRPDSLAHLPSVGRVLARVTQVASCSARDVTLPPEYAVVRIDAGGRVRPVVGRDPLHLELDDGIMAILRGIVSTGMQFATFLHQQAGRLVEVRVHSPEGRTTQRQPFFVATRPAASTLGLTLRQLEVLTAVATGAGNREIADELCLTQRTVAAHVEAILARLGCPSRAGAAAKATAAGVLLPSPDPSSVRSLTRVLQHPSPAAG
ncbi:response regulator transcription factor [Nocardioides albidus]|uniref:Response regulator transcription factor n=1 Tax=Nocardioides albidus TaxID=1517589 RepID=A0A5C4VNF7_9ACTN|nr:LuxR C-terminal-related transcriptional regulator [Nocardioides albidus]TNM37377.1 response regulator transcription factor [Nocardioides albidus]